jgi:hypothetical protein
LLEHASATFARAESKWEELWTSLVLARARAAAGQLDAAASELSTISAVAEGAGIALIVRMASEAHVALGLAGDRHLTPAPNGSATEAATVAPRRGATVAVVASAEGAGFNERLREWGEREAKRQHGAIVSAPDGFAVTFGVGSTSDAWTRGLRFALGLRCKGELLDVPISAGVAASVDEAARLLSAADTDRIVAVGEMSGDAQSWLDARHLVEEERTRAGALRLRQRVSTLRGEQAPPRHADQKVPAEMRNEFVLEGDFWSVRYAETTSRLRDSKGLRDIARLITAHGTEIAAVDLIAARTPSAGRVSGLPDEGFGIEGDAGEVLDAEAREQYRSRLIELDAEVDDASAANDPVRAERARDEREFLLAELRSSIGLHGRTRRAIDPSERARKAVTWRIRDAISRAEVVHPAFGRHLRRSVRTGSFCAYDPPDPTSWNPADRPSP